jgi:thioredoxin reductase (NADPH)
LVIEKAVYGGQITYSPKVENIPGFIELSGNEFAEKLVDQVLAQGADTEFCEVTSIIDGDVKTVVTDSGEFSAKAVIIATGAKHRMLGLEKEEQFVGNGVSFCAVCDGAFYKDKVVGVVGGGNSALQEALLLSDLASKVYVFQNLDCFTGEAKLAEQLVAKQNVEVHLSTVVTKMHGDDELNGVTVSEKGEEKKFDLDGLFVAIGLIPQNDAFSNVLNLNAWGYADVDESCKAQTKGIFVAGDCRSKRIRQVATAASDGAIAALAACDYVDGK